MKRLAQFIRSVIPSDPAQILFLLGSILLFISMQLRCAPLITDNRNIPLNWNDDPVAKANELWLHFSIVARLPIVLAGVAGIFVCFWPGKHPTRRTLVFVCLPALSGILALCMRFLAFTHELAYPFVSALDRGPHNQVWGIHTLWSVGPALHVSVLGLVMILVFLSRLSLGIASPPLSLAESTSSVGALEELDQWKRTKVFIFVSIAGTSVLAATVYFTVQAALHVLHRFASFAMPSAIWPIYLTLPTALLAGIAAWAAGDNRENEFKKFMAFPKMPVGLLSIVFAAGSSIVPNLLIYARDRIHWATYEFSRLSPPILASYVRIPDPHFWWYMLGAFFEEIIWRGYLQPRFVHRFGLMRGIFLLGLVWSGFHFLGDFQGTTEDYQVFVTLSVRVGLCVGWSYVLAWLTLRSGSIWPAAIAHGFHNVLAFSPSPLHEVLGRSSGSFVVIIYYGVLAIVLFKYWPPIEEFSGPAQLLELGTASAASSGFGYNKAGG